MATVAPPSLMLLVLAGHPVGHQGGMDGAQPSMLRRSGRRRRGRPGVAAGWPRACQASAKRRTSSRWWAGKVSHQWANMPPRPTAGSWAGSPTHTRRQWWRSARATSRARSSVEAIPASSRTIVVPGRSCHSGGGPSVGRARGAAWPGWWPAWPVSRPSTSAALPEGARPTTARPCSAQRRRPPRPAWWSCRPRPGRRPAPGAVRRPPLGRRGLRDPRRLPGGAWSPTLAAAQRQQPGLLVEHGRGAEAAIDDVLGDRLDRPAGRPHRASPAGAARRTDRQRARPRVVDDLDDFRGRARPRRPGGGPRSPGPGRPAATSTDDEATASRASAMTASSSQSIVPGKVGVAIGEGERIEPGLVRSSAHSARSSLGLDRLGLARPAVEHGAALQAVEGAGVGLGAVVVVDPGGDRPRPAWPRPGRCAGRTASATPAGTPSMSAWPSLTWPQDTPRRAESSERRAAS